MFIYVLATALSMFWASCAYRAKGIKQLETTYRILCILTFLPMTFVSVFRYEVGTDWPIYHDYFNFIAEGSDKFNEPLFNLLNRLIRLFTDDSWWLFAVCAFLICCFTFKAYLEQSVDPAFSILVFVLCGDYFNSQNQIRQALAMAIFLYAVKYIKERRAKRYFFWIFVAVLIHTSSLIYIAAYFLYGLKTDAKRLGKIYVISVLLFPFLQKILVALLSRTRYGWYFQSVYNTGDFYLLGFLVTSFFLILLLYYYHYGKEHGMEEDLQYNMMMYLYFFAAFSVLFSAAVPQMVRITTALTYVTPLLMPLLVKREHKRSRKLLLKMLIIAVFAVKLFYDVYRNGWYDAIPYHWVFFR